MSKAIRWSLDLRWQKPSEPVGFYGLKEGILMRSSKDPNMKVDWESFDAINRHDKQTAAMTGKVGELSFPEWLQGKLCFLKNRFPLTSHCSLNLSGFKKSDFN